MERTRVPRKLSFDLPESPARKPRTLNIPEPEAPVVNVARKPRIIAPEAPPVRKERPRTRTDELIDRARQQYPGVSLEIRGKIDMLLSATTEMLIDWGKLNLEPLQKASDIQAQITNDFKRLGALELLTEAKELVSRDLSFMRKLGGFDAASYEAKMKMVRSGLIALLDRIDTLKRQYEPEIADLYLDALAIIVTHTEFDDPMKMHMGSQRSKILLQSHQTGTMLVTALKSWEIQCIDQISQIDQMIMVTFPQWRLSQGL